MTTRTADRIYLVLIDLQSLVMPIIMLLRYLLKNYFLKHNVYGRVPCVPMPVDQITSNSSYTPRDKGRGWSITRESCSKYLE